MTKRIFVAGHQGMVGSAIARQLMDNSKLKGLDWEPRYSLREGLEGAYSWYMENLNTARGTR